MTNCRLLFVAPSAYCLGGMQVWLYNLVRALRTENRWNAQVALTSGCQHDLKKYLATFPDLPAFPIRNPSGSAEGRRRAIAAALLRQKPDLVIGVNIADLYPAAQRARRHGFHGKVALSLHALAADLLADIAVDQQGLDAVIATNRLSCRLTEQVGRMPHDRVFYAPYGVECHSPFGHLMPNRPSTFLSSAPMRIAWVGRLEQGQKRVHDVPAILRDLDRSGMDYNLTIVGDGPERDALTQALAPWISSGVVVMPGALSSRKLFEEVYASHQVLLITSSWETGPIVAWEAMAAGLVVVSSAYVGSGLEGALSHGHNSLLFPVGDPAAASAALLTLIDHNRRVSLAESGRKLVAGRYSAEATLRAWRRAIENILELPSLSPPTTTVQPPPAAGRLDQLLGSGAAESIRRCLGLSYRHSSPGGEWPHTRHGGADELALLDLAAELDRHA